MSKIYNKQKLEEIIPQCTSFSDCLRKLGLTTGSSNIRMLRLALSDFNINFDHFTHFTHRSPSCKRRTIKEVLVYGKLESSKLKHRLIREKLKESKCESCFKTDWLGQKIPLELHHVDGDKLNNNIENLQLLCPTCHTLTPNFKSKNRKTRKIAKLKITKEQYIQVSKCPSKEELEKLLWEIPSSHIGKKYGVSDKTIEKWSKKLGLSKPSRGYWQKKFVGKI